MRYGIQLGDDFWVCKHLPHEIPRRKVNVKRGKSGLSFFCEDCFGSYNGHEKVDGVLISDYGICQLKGLMQQWMPADGNVAQAGD